MGLLEKLLAGSFLLIGFSLYLSRRKANRLERELREERYGNEVEKNEDYLRESKKRLDEAERRRKEVEDRYRNPDRP